MHSERELAETALRVLVCWIHGQPSKPTDVAVLYKSFPGLCHLPVDELCCHIVHELCGRTVGDDNQPSQLPQEPRWRTVA
jgi:hypothetical protein